MSETESLLTAKDVAAQLSVSSAWVRDHAIGRRLPALPAIRMGGVLRFRRADLEQFLKRHTRNEECNG